PSALPVFPSSRASDLRVRTCACPDRTGGGAPTTSLPPPRAVRAPASGANACLPRSHRGGAPTHTPATTSYRRSTRLGCECVPARFAPGAVLLQMNLPPPRVVGAPAPGANELFPCDGLR